MRAEKWKAVLVILHLLYRSIPPLHGVTLCAVRAHLAAVKISVTIGAIPADVGEDRLDVALCAVHFFVHAPQGIAGLVVVEFWNCTNRIPAGRGVAVFAGNGERAMGISLGFLLRITGGEMSGLSRDSRRADGGGGCEKRPECDPE